MKKKTAAAYTKVEKLELPKENTECLNSLAKALIREAIINNKTRKDMYLLIDKLWNETFIEVFPLEEESEAEKAFRAKAKSFLEKNEEKFMAYFNNMSSADLIKVQLPAQFKKILYNNRGYRNGNNIYKCWECLMGIKPSIEIDTSIVLEIICAVNKAFSRYDHIKEKDIVEIAVKRMNTIYVEQRRSQAIYVKMVLDWLISYFKLGIRSKECLDFISQFDCENKFEEILCRLIFEVTNC